MRVRGRALSLAFAMLALTVSACGTEGPQSFIGESEGEVFFLQWTESSGSLSGSIQILSRDDGSAETEPITGIRQRDSVSLTLGKGSDESTWAGTVAGGELRLEVPSDEGGFVTVAFESAQLEEYNEVLASVRKEIRQRQDREKRQEEQAEREAAAQARARSDELRSAWIQLPVLGGTKEAFVQALGPSTGATPSGTGLYFKDCPSSGSEGRVEYFVMFTFGDYNAGYTVTRNLCNEVMTADRAQSEAKAFFPPDWSDAGKDSLNEQPLYHSPKLSQVLPSNHYRWHSPRDLGYFQLKHDEDSWTLEVGGVPSSR